MSDRSYSTEDVAKLKKLFTEGLRVMREMEDLREGLKDTVKSIAEEMDIKPAVLTKAIKIAHKSNLNEERRGFDELEEILEITGHTL
jgi:DNA-binding MarR family transcriptional regulator